MIRIMPLEQINANLIDIELLKKEKTIDSSAYNEFLKPNYSFCSSGKEAIRVICETLHLQRNDEVFITTTTDSSFVSTCVSATIFNFCKISRVLTENTKAIFVIHTFCFPHLELMKLRQKADELNIPLIEDCISAIDSYNEEGLRLGSIGDYAVYSLTKILPVNSGGIVYTKSDSLNKDNDSSIKKCFRDWLPYLELFKRKRRHNYQLLKALIGNELYNYGVGVNPFMYGFTHDNAPELIKQLNNYVECGLTHVSGEVHLPLNPFIDYERETQLIHFLEKEI